MRFASRPCRALVVGTVLLACFGLSCSPPAPIREFQGYLEAEYVYVASPYGGQLIALEVSRGDDVKAGQGLFVLDPEPEATARLEAERRVTQAAARLENLKKGKRPSELAALEALLDQARASLQLAKLELHRVERLRAENVGSVDDLDRARSNYQLYEAQVAQFEAELQTAKLGAREDEVREAKAQWEAAQAALEQATWNWAQKSQTSPAQGIVDDTLYRVGEWVAPGRPVVVLFPPGNLKVRFFVPEDRLAEMSPGRQISVNFDGASAPYSARVSYVSTHAEFTPPVIYSQQTRAKLVFMVEARFETADISSLRPGQPVDVILN